MRRPLTTPISHFLALSVAVHAVLLSELGKLAATEEAAAPNTVLTAELVTLPVAAPEPALVAPAASPRPAPTPPRLQPAPDSTAVTVREPAAEPVPAVAASEPEVVAVETAEPAPDQTSIAAAVSPAVEPPLAEAPRPTSVASAAVPTTPIQPVRDLPRSGSQSYEVFMGRSRLHVGKTLQTWSINDESYRISSSSETTGLASLFRPYQLDYVAEGRIDAAGFHPESFSVRRGRNGARQYAVRFDWSAKEMTLGPISAPRTVALPEGTYDVLSFIYQLSRAQLAPGRLQLNITTGNRLETYTLEVGREEDIEVPAGTIRAFPVRQLRRPGQESMEIWLAPERQLLPVRIRFFDRDGEMSGEQLAADIAFDGK